MSWDSSTGVVTRQWAELLRFDAWQGQEIFLFHPEHVWGPPNLIPDG
jgi:hypothetical protein